MKNIRNTEKELFGSVGRTQRVLPQPVSSGKRKVKGETEYYIKLLEAAHLKKRSIFRAQSPYCEVSLGKAKAVSRVHDHGGQSPSEWGSF